MFVLKLYRLRNGSVPHHYSSVIGAQCVPQFGWGHTLSTSRTIVAPAPIWLPCQVKESSILEMPGTTYLPVIASLAYLRAGQCTRSGWDKFIQPLSGMPISKTKKEPWQNLVHAWYDIICWTFLSSLHWTLITPGSSEHWSFASGSQFFLYY